MMTGALVERRSPGRRVTHESMCWVGAAQRACSYRTLLAVAPHLLGALDAGDTALGTCSPARGNVRPGPRAP
jgi:hypothetical protein